MNAFKNKLIMIKEENFKYNLQICNCTIATNFIRNTIALQNEPEEVLYLLGLDNKNNLVGFLEVARGTINGALTTNREILKRALIMNCSKIILTHNHPSGDPTPSKLDKDITKKISELSKMFDIELIDHIVIGDDKNYSIIADNEI